MHSIFEKSEITFGCGVKCTLLKNAKLWFSTIFFLQKILLIKVWTMCATIQNSLFCPAFNPHLSYYL